MFKKLQTWLKSREEAIKKEQELRKAKRFYSFLKAGGTFIKFIQEDLKKQENGMNRHQRRRFESELNDKGVLSPELVNYYQAKIDYILSECDKRLNLPKVQKQNNAQVSKEKPKDVA